MCLLLLAGLAARAETVVRADWEQARAMLTQGEFRPRIRVELKPSKWVKGKFIEATGAGLQVVYRNEGISFERENIRRIRLVPLKADRSTNRRMGIWGGIPAGIGAGILIAKATACSGSECSPGGVFLMLGVTMAAVTYGFYKLGGACRPWGRAG